MRDRSALYVGAVAHRRLHPRPYRLRHAVFWLLLDLDEIDSLDRRLWLFSKNQFNATSFYVNDHGEQTSEPLRRQVERRLKAEGVVIQLGRVQLLCMPRVFGYGFNPLSIYYCEDADGRLVAIIYEVRNTFGGRHSYVLPVNPCDNHIVRQSCSKAFYVSPFLDMALDYQFRVQLPDNKVAATVIVRDSRGPVLVASLTGRRARLTDRALLAFLLGMPLLTIKVILAIHWHALRMWAGGFVFHSQAANAASVSRGGALRTGEQ
jgi:uncharacterized protein